MLALCRNSWAFLLTLALLLPLAALAEEAPPPAPEAAGPCNAPDPGYGVYEPWVPNPALGQILMPRKGGLTAKDEFDLIIHFHGSKAARKELVKKARGVFVAGIDLGAGSAAYQNAFAQPEAFVQLLDSIEKAVIEHTGNPRAHIRHLALTGWSAGYGAIRAILRQKASAWVDGVALIDGLHADYDTTDASGLQAGQLGPFLRFAKRAARKKGFMFISHSRIVPPGYASTTETTHYIVDRIGGRITASVAQDSAYLSRYEQAQTGNFLMRGYLGEEKADHCAELGVMTDVVATLEKRWNTPVAKDGKQGPL